MKKEIEEKIDKKYNDETAKYIKKFLDINQKNFGHIVSNEQLAQRLMDNLNGDIKYPFQMVKDRNSAIYDKNRQKVFINPIEKFLSKFSKKIRDGLLVKMMHELDHASVAAKRTDGSVFSGIADKKEHILLNEGITAYKEKIYAKELKKDFSTGYKNELKVAEFIAEQIGPDKLIEYQTNNNYEAIETDFREKTGAELNDLVNIINEEGEKNTFFKKILKKVIPGKSGNTDRIDSAIQNIKTNMSAKTGKQQFDDSLKKDTPTLEEQAQFAKTVLSTPDNLKPKPTLSRETDEPNF